MLQRKVTQKCFDIILAVCKFTTFSEGVTKQNPESFLSNFRGSYQTAGGSQLKYLHYKICAA